MPLIMFGAHGRLTRRYIQYQTKIPLSVVEKLDANIVYNWFRRIEITLNWSHRVRIQIRFVAPISMLMLIVHWHRIVIQIQIRI